MKNESRYELTLLNLHDKITGVSIACDRKSEDIISGNSVTYKEILPSTRVVLYLLADDQECISIKCDREEMIYETGYMIESSRVTGSSNAVEVRFRMPHSNVTIGIDNECIKKEEHTMEPKNTQQQIIDSFQIEESVAKKLSDLLIKQSIRERLLNQNINNPTAYEQMENMLVPIVAEIESLKSFITKECVPAQYRSEKYVWNYDGYEIDGCTVYIYNA